MSFQIPLQSLIVLAEWLLGSLLGPHHQFVLFVGKLGIWLMKMAQGTWS